MTTVIVGSGGAAMESVKAMRACGDASEIHMFTTAESPALNPMLITYFLAGEIGYDDIFLFDLQKYNEYGVNIHAGSEIVKLDAFNKKVENAAGEEMGYDNCIVCSGALPYIPEAYVDKEVFSIRSASDALKLNERISAGKKALVAGASMIGVKVAEALMNRGMEVFLTDIQAQIFPLTAHENCARLIESALETKGVRLLLGDIDPDFSSFDLIVVCTGVKPNIGFIDKTQVGTRNGILVDNCMRTNCSGLYAAGDCAELSSTDSVYVAPGLWASARYMGRTAGSNAAGRSDICCEVARHNITHFFGVDFVSIGDANLGDDVFEMDNGGKYCRISWQDGRIMGINLLGMPEISGILRSQSLKSTELTAMALGKVFGKYPLIKEAFVRRGG